MIHNARNNQCGSSIEHTNFCCPFYRVGFSCSCDQCADAWHIKADGEDKCQSLCLGKVCRQDLRNICSISGSFCTKSGTDKTSACTIQRT